MSDATCSAPQPWPLPPSTPLLPPPPSPPRKVQLDATLRSLFHRKGRDDPEQLTWNELMSQFMENLRPAYQVALPGGEVQVRWVGGVGRMGLSVRPAHVSGTNVLSWQL